MEINYNNRLATADLIICPNLGQVIMGKEIQSISPVNMKVLMLLIKNQGQVVSRNQIFDSVWKNQEVSDDTLTRCISDLRAQIGKKHIKTLPKRGYQWMPIVKQDMGKTNSKITKVLLWIFLIIMGVFFLSLTSLWIAEKIIKPNQVRIAVLPISAKLSNQNELANHIESTLQAEVIKSEKLKLLSSSIIIGNLEKPYPYLSREYGAQWIIEGQITHYQNNVNVKLSLVDARTALVVYSLSNPINTNNINLLSFCQLFIQKIPVSKN